MKEMLPMKISNWESIEYSEGLNCPNENCDNKSYDDYARNIIGWCDTPYGYMMVCECKKCFTKYRFHGTIGDKFDPKTLKPFDRVLVRDRDIEHWICNLFSHIINDEYLCIGSCFIYCIPYNDDTKHLVGTKEEAPEYYRYWED